MPSPTFVDSSVGDHYEVKVDGEWTPVPNDRIEFSLCLQTDRKQLLVVLTRA
jgi:hypothetical protein